jgi:hypothetical protein
MRWTCGSEKKYHCLCAGSETRVEIDFEIFRAAFSQGHELECSPALSALSFDGVFGQEQS